MDFYTGIDNLSDESYWEDFVDMIPELDVSPILSQYNNILPRRCSLFYLCRRCSLFHHFSASTTAIYFLWTALIAIIYTSD